MTRASLLAAQYLELAIWGRRTVGNMGRRDVRGTRKVALELTLGHSQHKSRVPEIEMVYLFTFCPPGPDDRLKETSHIFFGIVSGSKLASQRRAALSSSSSASLCPARLVLVRTISGCALVRSLPLVNVLKAAFRSIIIHRRTIVVSCKKVIIPSQAARIRCCGKDFWHLVMRRAPP